MTEEIVTETEFPLKELEGEIVHLFEVSKTYLCLRKHELDIESDPGLSGVFHIISESIMTDIVNSVFRLILDNEGEKSGKERANLKWFLDQQRDNLSDIDFTCFSIRMAELQESFSAFKIPRHNFHAHLTRKPERARKSQKEITFKEFGNCINSLFLFWNELCQKIAMISVTPTGVGPAGLEYLLMIIREYKSGPYKRLIEAIGRSMIDSFRGKYDPVRNVVVINLDDSPTESDREINDNGVITRYNNGNIIGVDILNAFTR